MHVLMIPSWYPQTPDDFNGSFFREQAQAIAGARNQVGVLAVQAIPLYAIEHRRRRRTIDIEVDKGVTTVRTDVVLPIPKAHGVNYAMHYKRVRRAFVEYTSRQGMPEVLHAHSMFPAGVLSHRLSVEFNLPFIITEHRPSSIERLRSRWLRRNGTAAAIASDRRIAVAKDFADELTKAYGAEIPWEYFPGLLSPQLESAPLRAAPTQPPFVFGHISHLDPGKRVDLLIESFADRFAGDDRTMLRIAGDSPESGRLKLLARECGVEDQVYFVGAVPRESIADEFACLHAFVLPSSAEAFGTVIWEAMALGIPVVSSRTWAGLNAVDHEVGLLFDIDDCAQFGTALTEMRGTFEQYDSRRIRSRSIGHCGKDAFNSLYSMAYRRAMDDGSRRPRSA